ncbi:hypothetical protein AUJ46_00170 [Candidatus Peregrinibacteria bacterium CG1_02_54_53]|nr:MAG: hypothetical protein AUJ46_00170 [Candidatus Peregrinibacteria bacterium CG1_02_54_53]
MPSLRIELLPLEKAVHNALPFNEMVIKTAREAIAARHIADLCFVESHAMQCVLWISVPDAGLATLQKYLDDHHFGYTSYPNSPEPQNDGQKAPTRQNEQ